MAISVKVKVVPFGEINYQTGALAEEPADATIEKVQESSGYVVPRETAPRVHEIRYESEPPEYRVPSSTG